MKMILLNFLKNIEQSSTKMANLDYQRFGVLSYKSVLLSV